MKLAISLHEITSSDRFWNEVVYRLPFWPAGEIVHPLTAAQLKGLIRHISLEPSENLLLYRAYYTVDCE
jgi:hypothetical protein